MKLDQQKDSANETSTKCLEETLREDSPFDEVEKMARLVEKEGKKNNSEGIERNRCP